jgi:hypothetical protein
MPFLNFDATFVSLQREVRMNDATALQDPGDVLHFGDELNNFSDTAAIISNLDLVISVDTSVAPPRRCAGKTGLDSPAVCPWLEMATDREYSPWYPTARLFRQNRTRPQDDVITRV